MLNQLAAKLAEAERTRVPIGQLTAEAELTIADAYRIQLINIEKKLEAGAKVSGKKIGLTSLAMQELLGVGQPDFGHLLDTMEVADSMPTDDLVQPRAEGEIAFVLASDLPPTGVGVEDVLDATAYVAPAIEIVDSRVADWKIAIQDTVADNASSGRYVLGAKRFDPRAVDLKSVSMQLVKNGELINTGKGSAVLGDPAVAVAWLANAMGEFGVQLLAGEVILSGALSAMTPVVAGDQVTAIFDTLGSASVRFE
ncbi:MAG: fumarylacetoacetate hydrolase family protein [Propionibacteriaceae bacterium]|jgi:2-keto-4-pentenoate hydratase|nr:fumarylacetoacetate hydrolase family protein [Propionibacteriaceae bacterium]